MREDYDLTCVVHLHSTYSDGTGTVPEIARAAERAGVDVVLLTDHDTLAAKRNGEERWYDRVLVLVGEEVTPVNRDHYLAFDINEEIDRRLSGRQICEAVRAAGGFGFGAHPFSRGSRRLRRPGMKFRDPDALDGIELWSFLNDTGERVRGLRELARMIWAPQRAIGGPPPDNLREWDRLCQARRVVAIGGLDAHQFGIRVGGRVPLRLMSYARSFKQLHTHVLCERAPTRELEHDRSLVYDALRAGRCYIANDQVADAGGFAFSHMGEELALDPGIELHVRTPQAGDIRLLRDGEVIASTHASELHHSIERHGVHRVEVFHDTKPWIYSNPVYIRG
ncbi:MAG TPA: CehA/McbA family metallohydrolase [Thermoleophilaceae bacterium]|nr:CehA/McbA family metallohydrolase [Thermoleophilaceae bacterium]